MLIMKPTNLDAYLSSKPNEHLMKAYQLLARLRLLTLKGKMGELLWEMNGYLPEELDAEERKILRDYQQKYINRLKS